MIICMCGHMMEEHVIDAGECLKENCLCGWYEPSGEETNEPETVQADVADLAQEFEADQFAAMYNEAAAAAMFAPDDCVDDGHLHDGWPLEAEYRAELLREPDEE